MYTAASGYGARAARARACRVGAGMPPSWCAGAPLALASRRRKRETAILAAATLGRSRRSGPGIAVPSPVGPSRWRGRRGGQASSSAGVW